MRIKSLTITSPTALDLRVEVTSPICLLHGEHSALALDLIRELIQDDSVETDPDGCDDGHFVMHADVEMDGKSYNVCYIRNADVMGDHRLAVNFTPNSLDYSLDDTREFIDKCRARSRNESNVICNHKVFRITEDDRPLFVYCEDADDVTQVVDFILNLNRQAFVAVRSNQVVARRDAVQTVSVG